MFATRVVKAARKFTTTADFKPKSAWQVWSGDIGAYPVIATCTGAVIFCFSFAFGTMFNHPDARLSKGKRKSIFRGDVKDE